MPLPVPLPLWAKVAIWAGETFAFQAGMSLFEHVHQEDDEEAMAWAHHTVHYGRATPATTSEDRAQIGFDVVKLGGGGVDATWDTAQIQGSRDHLVSLVNSLRTYTSSVATAVELRSYVKKFKTIGPGFAPMGDPIDVMALGHGGLHSAGPNLPYQVALSVTERTAMRKHWGRVYLPNPASNMLTAEARWSAASTLAIATIFADTAAAMAEDNLYFVVPSSASRTLFTVTAIQVDDIPDVQRRRRPRTTVTRSTIPTV